MRSFRTRPGRLGRLAIVVVLFVGLSIPAWWATTSPTCACVAPDTIDVVNRQAPSVTIRWHAPGFLWTPLLAQSDSRTIEGCTATGYVLRSGDYQVTLTAGGASRTFPLAVTNGERSQTLVLTVGADGQISGATEPSSSALLTYREPERLDGCP